ncbi:MAG: hypothetical protein HC912_06235 [Saprospiraceae bacterium]|nr:hypothetical protein [Saprospiraceae bacterium]
MHCCISKGTPQKNDTTRAQAVAEVDERIYHLILAIEQAREIEAKEVMAA